MLESSIAEQKLISFVREEFGEFLTRFLLAGLGEEAAGRGWQFNITYSAGEAITLERHVQVLTYEPADGQSYLPRSRDPLVLSALLQLLISSPVSQHNLLYGQESVPNLLGWDDTQEVRGEIADALERYSLITFKWSMNRAELINRNLSHYTARECLISEYETIDDGETEFGQMSHMHNRVTFSHDFIKGLRHRSLFGIDWNNVREVVRRVVD